MLRRYMCYNYLRSGTYTAKSEIFSLGIVFAELLTGRLQGDQDMDFNLPRILRQTPADARAGGWPADAVKQLKALVGRCVDSDIEERPADMATVMRELRRLLDQHCPASAAEVGDAIIAELAAARAELDRICLEQQFQGMQLAGATELQLPCCVCMDDFVASDGCACSVRAPGHFYCNECFSNMVISQVTGENKPVFLKKGCEITCAVCQSDGLRSIFDMRFCGSHLTLVSYTSYHKTMAEPEILCEQNKWQQRIQQLEADFKVRLENTQRSAVAAWLDPHLKHIADELILPRCPIRACRLQIADFDACAALQVSLLVYSCVNTRLNHDSFFTPSTHLL